MQMNMLQTDLFPAAAAVPPKKSPSSKSSASTPPPSIAVKADQEEKAPTAFKTISEAAEALDVPQHVLRFWESKFSQIKPTKRHGGRRYYRPQDMDVLFTIKQLLYQQGYTIKGAKQWFNDQRKAPAPKSMALAEPTKATQRLSDRQISQLSMLRLELVNLRDALRPYVPGAPSHTS